MNRSPLDNSHRRSGAKMVPFAGWELPVFFSGIVDEHLAVRQKAGIFDISHLGQVRVVGPGASSTISRLLTADTAKLKAGQGRYSLALNERGGIADDLFVYRTGHDEFLLVPNASNTTKVAERAEAVSAPQTGIEDVTARNAVVAVQGPSSPAVLKAIGVDLSLVARRYALSRQTVGSSSVMISRSGYTGEEGFEFYCSAGSAPALWALLLAKGEPHGLRPCGLGARDTLRLEMCYPLWGNDIDETTNPLEAGLMFAVDFGNEHFTGREALRVLIEGPQQRRLIALEMKDGIARAGNVIYTKGPKVGDVTSGTFSPSLRKGIALGYVRTDLAVPGQVLTVDVRGKRHQATVVQKPFYRKEP